MSSYESKPIDIYETQKQVIQNILDEKRRQGIIKSDEEMRQELTMLLEQLKPKLPMMKERPQLQETNSEIHNQTFEEVGYDLNTVFSQINQIDETINKHQRLNQSLLNNIQLRIQKTHNNLTKDERLAETHSSQQIHLETFIDSDSFENDLSYYDEVPISYRAKLDLQREAIKLPAISSQSALIGPGGVQLGSIKIGKQLGAELIRLSNPENSVDKAADVSSETFWSESVLADSPMKVNLGPAYYNIDHGAMAQLDIFFDYLTQVNEINLTIFGEYPLDIIGVRYFTTDNQDEAAILLIDDSRPSADMRSRIVKTSTSYQFQDIYAKRMQLVVRQRHYIKSDFIASTKNQRELEMWFKGRTLDDPTNGQLEAGLINKPTYQNKMETNNPWWYYRNLIDRMKVLEINQLIDLMNDDQPNMITKYEYNYGLYNLDLRKNEYQNTGYYVSKAIPTSSSVRTLSLEVAEEHPSSSVLNRFTDIEYSIHDGRSWHPIMPTDPVRATKVENELLTFTASSQGAVSIPLRFPVDTVITAISVYRNGIALPGTKYTTALGADGLTVITIDATSYDVTSVYTAAYTPKDSARVIDFLTYYKKQDGSINTMLAQEAFQGTDRQGKINLKYFPYVDRQKLNSMGSSWNPTYLSQEADNTSYLPLKVKIIDPSGYHIEQPTYPTDTGVRVENVTDYFDTSISRLKTYNEAASVYYQYRVIGNEIHFNTPIPEETRIVVEYPYLIGDIRLKAVLRRNAHSLYGFTPILKEYLLHMQTLI